MGFDTDWKEIEKCDNGFECPKCHTEYHNIMWRQWTSSDEAHEDYQYRCLKCGSEWWVEGADY
jgi:DNA-directed RNA polymerase subunit M/transcription elongation factor TFIIS